MFVGFILLLVLLAACGVWDIIVGLFMMVVGLLGLLFGRGGRG